MGSIFVTNPFIFGYVVFWAIVIGAFLWDLERDIDSRKNGSCADNMDGDNREIGE